MIQPLLLACLTVSAPLGIGTQDPTAVEAPAEVADLSGSWEGSIEIPGQALEFDLDFERLPSGEWSGDISIPAQGATDLPLTAIGLEGDQATFRIQEVPGDPTFDGSLDQASLSGTFLQGGAEFPFSCQRAGLAAKGAKERLAAVFPLIEQALADHNVPSLGVAVVYKGEVLLADGFGFRDVEGKVPADGDTLYSIGSSTKAFTAFAVAQLVEQGKLDWDTLVKDVLPGFDLHDEYATDHITVQDLLIHRSGLPRHDFAWYLSTDATRPELLGAMEFLEPNARLGERFQYQNFMYMTAGMVVEAITGKSWEESLTESVLAPLGMGRTNFEVPQDADGAAATGSALPYNPAGEPEGGSAAGGDHLATVELEDYYPITAMGPAGSIRSSANEMTRWLQLLLAGGEFEGEELLGKSQVQHLMTSHSSIGAYPSRTDEVTVGYGLGWFLQAHKGHYYVQHGGNINGFSAMVGLYPLDGLGIVVLANRNSTGLPNLVALTIADHVLELEIEDWLAAPGSDGDEDEDGDAKDGEDSEDEDPAGQRVLDTTPAHPLADYAGTYHHAAYGTVSVALAAEGTGLTGDIGDGPWPMIHWHYEVFQADGDGVPDPLQGMAMQFRTDVTGRIESLEIAAEPSIDPIVFERQPDASLRDPEFLDRLVGSYAASEAITLTISRVGDELRVSQNGSPLMKLDPLDGTSFRLAELQGFTLEFELPETGPATVMIAHEPGDSTRCERIEEDSEPGN